MANLLTIEVDTAALMAALDRIPALVEKHVLIAAEQTAQNVAREARARVARATGKTAAGIGIEVAKRGPGYVVFSDRPDQPGLPGWLEFGTKKMAAQPFFFASARLEEGPHDRRMREAIADAIGEGGLGD
jgi:hypothetical protein